MHNRKQLKHSQKYDFFCAFHRIKQVMKWYEDEKTIKTFIYGQQCAVSPMHSHKHLKFGFYKATKVRLDRLNTHWRVQIALYIQYIWLNPDGFNCLGATQLIWSELSRRNHSIFSLDLQPKCSTLMRGKM